MRVSEMERKGKILAAKSHTKQLRESTLLDRRQEW